MKMSEAKWDTYLVAAKAELTPWTPDFDMSRVSVSAADKSNGSPKLGDMIRHDIKNHDDQWIVNEEFFKEHFKKA